MGHPMGTYIIRFVDLAYLVLWHEFWDGDEPSHRSIQANKDGRLQRSTVVEARNAVEAAEKVTKEIIWDVMLFERQS